MKRVFDEQYPRNIDAFGEIVCECILLNDNREPSVRRQSVAHIRHFVRWCKNHDIEDIQNIRREHVEAFVKSATNGGGKPRKPGMSTQRNRVSGVRSAFRASRQFGYELPDPTIDIVILIDRTIEACICTDADIDKLRDGSPEELFDSSYAALLALAEAGASNGEIREIRVGDIDLDEGVVHLPGNARIDERSNPLTEWGISLLRARLERLGPDDFVVWNAYGG